VKENATINEQLPLSSLVELTRQRACRSFWTPLHQGEQESLPMRSPRHPLLQAEPPARGEGFRSLAAAGGLVHRR